MSCKGKLYPFIVSNPAVPVTGVYVDMRDATLAANEIRYGGVDVPLLWNAFAQHGLGRDAASAGSNDADATSSFASPHGRNATVRFAAGAPARLYVGGYEARAVPVADTDPATPLPDTFEMTSGRYSFTVVAPGFGESRFDARSALVSG